MFDMKAKTDARKLDAETRAKARHGDIPQAPTPVRRSGAPGLSVLAEGSDDRPPQPGLGERHYLYPDEARIRLPGGDPRLGDAQGSGAPSLDWHNHVYLYRSARRSDRPVRPTGDLHLRSGQPVHDPRIYPSAQGSRREDQHGRQGPMGGQRGRRAAVEEREVRAYLFARIRQRTRGEATARQLLRVLQRRTPAFVLGRANAEYGIL